MFHLTTEDLLACIADGRLRLAGLYLIPQDSPAQVAAPAPTNLAVPGPANSQPPAVPPANLAVPGPANSQPPASGTNLAALDPFDLRDAPSSAILAALERAVRSPSHSREDLGPVEVLLSANTHHKVRTAQVMLRHAVPTGEMAAIVDRALDALITDLRRRKVGAGRSPRTHTSAAGRYIPPRIRRAVWDRDQGQCTFVGTTERCSARRGLVFEDIEAALRGVSMTADGFRLLCRVHHEYRSEGGDEPRDEARDQGGDEARDHGGDGPVRQGG